MEDGTRLGLELSGDQARALLEYESLLTAKAIPAGLISSSDAGRLYERHIRDSLAAASVLREEDRAIVDLGSGAGLPGIVLCIAAPTRRVLLVESRSSRVGFLEFVVDRLDLRNAEVFHGRVQNLAQQRAGAFHLATARAFAPMERSWEAAFPLLRPGGRLVYFAGTSLTDPKRAAETLSDPAPPASVTVELVLDSPARLVIMART